MPPDQMFDPKRKPRVPQAIKERLEYRQHYFDPKIGEDEDGFSLTDAESLGWKVAVSRAVKHFPGRGQVEVHTDGDADSVLRRSTSTS